MVYIAIVKICKWTAKRHKLHGITGEKVELFGARLDDGCGFKACCLSILKSKVKPGCTGL